jgi:4-hydroxy-4-methyl-2-oxoglutarate aldolase
MIEDGSKVYRDVPRVDPDLIARLRELTVADLHEALPAAARDAGLLSPRVRAIVPGIRTYGQAVTAYCTPGDSLMAHCALYVARPGDVLVLSNGGVPTGAMWGGHMAFDAQTFGLAGSVIDGPVRDVADLRELRYPVWASSTSVSRAEKLGAGYVNMPVSCGSCVINPGDIVVADDDGVLVFGPENIEPLVGEVRSRLRRRSNIRPQIKEGQRLFDTQKFGDLLETHGIAIQDGHWRSKRQRTPDA